MPHVITQHCCNDATCVSACPVDCIHPRPGEPEFATAELLFIDPEVCIDCGACIPACPVDAIYAEESLPSGRGDLRAGLVRHRAHQPSVSGAGNLDLCGHGRHRAS